MSEQNKAHPTEQVEAAATQEGGADMQDQGPQGAETEQGQRPLTTDELLLL